MKIKYLSFCIGKSDYYNAKDPLYHLISNYNDIKSILKIEDKKRLLEFFNTNKKKINDILNDEENIIAIEPNEKMKNLPCNVYLSLLINDDLKINYTFPFDYITEINAKRKVINNKYKELLLSIHIISLIRNYKESNDYNEKDKESIEIMENENKNIYENNVDVFNNSFGIDLNGKIELKIDELYMKIIKGLILNRKFDDYEYACNILNQIELSNMNLTKQMIDELCHILNEKEKYVNDYLIMNKEDLYNEKKINFHYILLNFILKKSIYIYQFNFLVNTKKIIIENLKQKKLYSKKKTTKLFNQQFEYLIKTLSDSEYYWDKYLDNTIEILKEVQTYFINYLFDSKKEDILSIENIIKNIKNNSHNNDNDYHKYFQYYDLSKNHNLRIPIINYFYINKHGTSIRNETKYKSEVSAFAEIEENITKHKIKNLKRSIKQILYNFINEDEKNKDIIINIIGVNDYNFLINELNEGLNKGEKLINKINEIENINIINEKKENKSLVKKTEIILSNNITSFNKTNLYSFIGKIIKKETTQILLLTSIDKIVILIDIGEKFKDFDENQYIKVSNVIFSSENNGIIHFSFKFFSNLKKIDEIKEENSINQKIAIKFNLLDYNEFDDILITQIGLELANNNIIKFKSDKKIIFYVYDASNLDYDYFPQKIYLYDSNENSLDFKFFVYKSLLNEINLFVKQKYSCSYEFLYFSLDNSLPKEIQINYHEDKIFKSSEFHTFNSTIRKSIIFINIPPQNKNDSKFGKNLLNIYLCNKEKTKLYGTFSLDSIRFKTTKPYKYKSVVDKNIINIYKDYIQCFENSCNPEKFRKYLCFEESVKKVLENEINENFHLYKYDNIEYTLIYFNSLCFWNFYYFIQKTGNLFSLVKKYMNIYKKVNNAKCLSYIEKSMILVGFVKRVFEDKENISCPEFFFYEELYENNPYRVAYNFQFELINNITERSCLFQPFLFLDSFIMDCLQSKSFGFVSTIISGYSISMLPIELIKKDLKKSIKNYFLVLIKEGKINKRRYYASVQKYNNLITYNENILLKDSIFNKMYDLDIFDIVYNPKTSRNFAFILNLENIHENLAHNKEEIINIKNSPTLYFDRNLNCAYVYHYDTKDYGEAGKLIEEFIIGGFLIDSIKITKYEMGEYFDVKYFVDTDFKKLYDGFINILQFHEQMRMDKENKETIHQTYYIDSTINIDLKKIGITLDNEKIEKDKTSNKKNSSLNKKSIEKNDNNDNKEIEKIYLTRHNTYILSADTFEELMVKVKDMENKKIIVREDAIENNNDNCNY